ncbi:MAG: GntR family transcriptional regulator [Thermomicrobiales bacterium]|nr:GntR family transcriptional regulator [Thermomicrobiales bacterium]
MAEFGSQSELRPAPARPAAYGIPSTVRIGRRIQCNRWLLSSVVVQSASDSVHDVSRASVNRDSDVIKDALMKSSGEPLAFNVPKSLSQMTEQHLETEIIEGRLAPGTRLNPEEIAQRLGISKSPVREALILLHRDGLVTCKPRSVYVVSEINVADLHEIYPIRAALNARMMRIIMSSASAAATAERLTQLLEPMRRAMNNDDTHGYYHANTDFYKVMVASCPNSRLRVMWHKLSSQIARFRFLLMSQPGHIRLSFREHEKLVKAMRAGDTERASKLAESIIDNSLAELARLLTVSR